MMESMVLHSQLAQRQVRLQDWLTNCGLVTEMQQSQLQQSLFTVHLLQADY